MAWLYLRTIGFLKDGDQFCFAISLAHAFAFLPARLLTACVMLAVSYPLSGYKEARLRLSFGKR
jgi:hypothetical protein